MMSASDIPELDTAGLRKFGITTGAILAVLFGLAFPYLLDRPWPVWPWIVFAILAAWAIAAPNSLKPIYHGWMRVGMFLGRVTTPIIMTLVFVVAFIPFALVLRIMQRDFMRRKFDESSSYRVKSKPPSVENMEKPY